MISKKIGILLGSVVAGLGLVGATFAAWAVTDNANPLGIKISPTAISEETAKYSTMVLEWGDTTEFTNISNIKVGVPEYLHVQVKSKVTKNVPTDTQTGGNLSIGLSDLTASHTQGAPELIKNLVIEAYTDEGCTEAKKISALTLDSTHTSVNADIETPSTGAAYDIYFKVYIPSTVTSAQYNQMVNDLVYFTVDWNKPSGVTPVSTQTVYYKSTSGTPNAYAYKEANNTISKNGDWPGPQMTVYDATAGIYQYTVNMSEFDTIIFSVNGANQTADLEIPALTNMTPYYNGTTWVAAPAKGEVVNAEYYLLGTWNAWSTEGQTALSNPVNGVYSVDIQVPAGETYKFKVKENTSNTWYSYSSTENGAEDCNWVNNTGTAQTITIQFSPTKTLNNGLQYVDAGLKA